MSHKKKLLKSLLILTLTSMASPALFAQEPLWNQPVSKPSAAPLWFNADSNGNQQVPSAANLWFENAGTKPQGNAPQPKLITTAPLKQTQKPATVNAPTIKGGNIAPTTAAPIMKKQQLSAAAPVIQASALGTPQTLPATATLPAAANQLPLAPVKSAAAPVVSAQVANAQVITAQAVTPSGQSDPTGSDGNMTPKTVTGDAPESWIRNAVIAAPATKGSATAKANGTQGATIVSAAEANTSARNTNAKPTEEKQARASVAVAAEPETLIVSMPQVAAPSTQAAPSQNSTDIASTNSMPPVVKPSDVLAGRSSGTAAPVFNAAEFATGVSSSGIKLSELALANGELPVDTPKLEMSPQLAAVTLQPPKLLDDNSVQLASANETGEESQVSFDLASAVVQSGKELNAKQSESSASDGKSSKAGKFDAASMVGPLTDSNILFSTLKVEDRFETYAAHVPSNRSREEDLITQPAWPMDTYTWISPVFYHKPLYFEQPNLERYGIGTHRWLQPAASSIHFFGSIPLIPYKVLTQHPCEKYYTLGNRRPGNCVPVQRGVILGQSYVGEIRQFWEPCSGY